MLAFDSDSEESLAPQPSSTQAAPLPKGNGDGPPKKKRVVVEVLDDDGVWRPGPYQVRSEDEPASDSLAAVPPTKRRSIQGGTGEVSEGDADSEEAVVVVPRRRKPIDEGRGTPAAARAAPAAAAVADEDAEAWFARKVAVKDNNTRLKLRVEPDLLPSFRAHLAAAGKTARAAALNSSEMGKVMHALAQRLGLEARGVKNTVVSGRRVWRCLELVA